MFLLFLCLGTVSVKAQVRIGGNTAPSVGAVLDLNATDATNNGTKGLTLPRVNLTSNTMQLTPGVANLGGMLVYSVNTSVGAGLTGAGVYFWNGAKWASAFLPYTSAADSGSVLMSTGSSVKWSNGTLFSDTTYHGDSIRALTSISVTWMKIVDTSIIRNWLPSTRYAITIPGLTVSDICFAGYYAGGGRDLNTAFTTMSWTGILYISSGNGAVVNNYRRIRCYRPSA